MKISTIKLRKQLRENKKWIQSIPLENREIRDDYIHSCCDGCQNSYSLNQLFLVSGSSQELICHNCIDIILRKVFNSQ